MSDPVILLSLATMGMVAVAASATAGLRGWEDWLDLRREEIELRRARSDEGGSSEIERLRKRIRRLEAIATGRAPDPGD